MTNIKKIVIWALVIVNVAFLAVFLWRRYSAQIEKNETLEYLSTLFNSNGIYLDIDGIQEGDELPALQSSRDIQGERKLAETLLGATEVQDQGGVIYTYTAQNGGNLAVFGNGGAFEITFTAPVYDSVKGAANTAKSLLRAMGIETISVDASGEEGNETVEAVCSWQRQPIFNCRISFVFENGRLVQITGNYTSAMKLTSNTADMSSPATALMRFLNEVKNSRISCSRILEVRPGYKLRASGDGAGAVWRIQTDNGVFFSDVSTGNIEPDIP